MSDKTIKFFSPQGETIPVKAIDNNDGTYALGTDAVVNINQVTLGTVAIDQVTAHANEVVVKDVLVAPKDGGLGLVVTRTFTHAADGSTAFDITTAPGGGNKVVAIDVLLSVGTACRVTVQMETSGNVLAGFYLPNNGSAQLTLRGYLKGDAAGKREQSWLNKSGWFTAPKLQVQTSVASAVDVTCVWFAEV